MPRDRFITSEIFCDIFCNRTRSNTFVQNDMIKVIKAVCKKLSTLRFDEEEIHPITVYGTGEHSRILYKYWTRYGCPKFANWVVTSNPTETKFMNKKVYSISDLTIPIPKLVILSSQTFESEIAVLAKNRFPNASILSIWNKKNSRFGNNLYSIKRHMDELEDALWVENAMVSLLRKKSNFEKFFKSSSKATTLMIGSKKGILSFFKLWNKIIGISIDPIELSVGFACRGYSEKYYLPKYYIECDDISEIESADLIFVLATTFDEEHSLLDFLRLKNANAKIFCIFGKSYNPL